MLIKIGLIALAAALFLSTAILAAPRNEQVPAIKRPSAGLSFGSARPANSANYPLYMKIQDIGIKESQ